MKLSFAINAISTACLFLPGNFAKNVDEEANKEKKDANFLSQKFDDYQSTRYLENNVPIDFNSNLLGAEANVPPSMNEWTLLGGSLLTDPGLTYFGDTLSVSRSGSRIAVGAWFGNYVKVYDFDGFKYEQVGSTITNNNDPDVAQVGRVVSMSEDGNRIGFVAPQGAGNVLVYEWKNGDWSQLGDKIVLNEWAFSFSMSGDGKRFIVGFGSFGSNNEGSVKVFEEVNEVWTPLGSAIIGKNDNENFGCYGVAMNYVGSRIVVGAPYILYENPSQGSGYARVYELNSDWNQVGDDLALTLGVSGDEFGESVDMCNSGMNIIVGARGGKKAIVYTQTVGGWTQRGAELGQVGDVSEVSMSGDSNTVAVGTVYYGAKVYNYASMWNDLGLQHPTGERFGTAISLSSDGETIGIGGPSFDGAGGEVGLYTKKFDITPTTQPVVSTGSPSSAPIVATGTPTDTPSAAPTDAPTIVNDVLTCSCTGDPHYKMWNGEYFSFQGNCDQILIDNDYLQLQVRTRPSRGFSLVSQVALKLKNPDRTVFQFNRGDDPIVNSDSKIEYEAKYEEFFYAQSQIYLAPKPTHIFTFNEGGRDQYIKVTETWHGGFGVNVKGHSNLFTGSKGMCGNWNAGGMTKRYHDTEVVTVTSGNSINAVRSWQVQPEGSISDNSGESILIDPSAYCEDKTKNCNDVSFSPDTTFDCYDEDLRRLGNKQGNSTATPIVDLECANLSCAAIQDSTMRAFCESDVRISGDPRWACQIDYLISDVVTPDPCGFDVENNNSKFLRSRKGGTTKIRSCGWLKRRKEKFRSRLCSKQVGYFEIITTGDVLAPPQIACPDTCASCDKCFENPKTKYTHKVNEGDTPSIYKTCKWLAKKSPEKVKNICNKYESVGGYPTPIKGCPVTCGLDTCVKDGQTA